MLSGIRQKARETLFEHKTVPALICVEHGRAGVQGAYKGAAGMGCKSCAEGQWGEAYGGEKRPKWFDVGNADFNFCKAHDCVECPDCLKQSEAMAVFALDVCQRDKPDVFFCENCKEVKPIGDEYPNCEDADVCNNCADQQIKEEGNNISTTPAWQSEPGTWKCECGTIFPAYASMCANCMMIRPSDDIPGRKGEWIVPPNNSAQSKAGHIRGSHQERAKSMNRDKCCAMILQPGDPTGENAQECGSLADVILKDQPFCASCALPIWQEMLKDRDREILEFIGKSLDNLANLIHSQFSVPRLTAKRLIVRANLEPLHKCIESKQSGCCLICDKPLAQIREQQASQEKNQ